MQSAIKPRGMQRVGPGISMVFGPRDLNRNQPFRGRACRGQSIAGLRVQAVGAHGDVVLEGHEVQDSTGGFRAGHEGMASLKQGSNQLNALPNLPNLDRVDLRYAHFDERPYLTHVYVA